MTTSEIRHSNRTVLDFKKVAYAGFYYRAKGHERHTLPKSPTVNNVPIDPDAPALFHAEYPGETCLERATRLEILDKWTPVAAFVLSNGHRLEFTGDKAIALRDAYRKLIFKKS